MKKALIIPAFLAVLLAFATCDNPAGGGDPSGGGATPVTPPSFSFSGVNKYVATSNGNSGQIKGSFKSGGLEYYYIYLGQLENIPLVYGMKYYHTHEYFPITYQYTKADTDTISTMVTESSSQTVSVSEMHTKTTTSETTLKAEASVKYKGLFVTAEAKASAEQKWKTYTEDTSGFQKDTSFTNTVMYGSSKAVTTQESISIPLTERNREGYYRFTFFSVSDVYLWVIKDPKQPGALDLEFKEYINPKEFVWKMDYTDPGNPEFNKTDDTKFKLALSFLDSLPKPEVDLDYVEEISMDRTSIGVLKGSTFQLSPRIKPDYATEKGVIWISSNTAVATVSNTGVVTGVSDGKATITATPKDPAYKGNPATCIVDVSTAPILVTGVNLNKTSTTILVGGIENLIPTIIPSTATNPNVTWRTNPASSPVATVSNGVVTALAVGTVAVIVKTEDGGFEKTCTVTVKPVPVNGVTLNIPEKLTLDFPDKVDYDSTYTFTWEVTPTNAANKNVIWTSSNTAVATVSNGTVTAKAAGTTTITVKTEDGGFTKSVTFTVRGAWNVTDELSWVKAFTGIRSNGSGTASVRKDHVINVGNDFNVTGEPANTTFDSVTYITVTLQGTGTLGLKSQGRLLTIGSSQTVIIDSSKLILKGLDKEKNGQDNNTTVVRVNGSGTLILKNGIISGNTNATFNADNSGSSYNTNFGGGVFVDDSGSFTMEGGTIKENKVYSENYTNKGYYCQSYAGGGGVYVASRGRFTMTGGIIEGNSAISRAFGSNTESVSRGGGVFISKSSTFSKSGVSIISGNDATPKNECKAYAEGNTYISGHSVFWNNDSPSWYRNTTANPSINMSTSDSSSGVWTKY